MEQLPSKRWIWTLILSLAGILVSAYLSRHFYEVRSGAAGFQSFCNLGANMNCDLIAASRWAELFWGIPLSSLAAGWFVAAAILSLLIRSQTSRVAYGGLFKLWSILGLIVCGVFFLIMHQVVKTYCVLCLVTDALVFGIFLLTLRFPLSFSKIKGADLKNFAVVSGGSAAVSILLLSVLNPATRSEFPIKDMVNQVLNRPPVSLNVGTEIASMGAPDARVTIVEFSDFQCPFCKRGALLLNSVLNRFPKDLRIVFKNYPLDPSCNAKMPAAGGHRAACESARAAHCAHQQGRFTSVYEALFDQQEKLAPGIPTSLAKAVTGIDPVKMEECLNHPDTLTAIRRDLEEGDRLGVTATPTFFINGHKVEGLLPPEAWVELIWIFLKHTAT